MDVLGKSRGVSERFIRRARLIYFALRRNSTSGLDIKRIFVWQPVTAVDAVNFAVINAAHVAPSPPSKLYLYFSEFVP